MRRQIAKGMALLNKDAWTPALDYRHSLALRSDRTVIDSSAPYALRIEQIYRPSIELTPALTTKVSIRPRTAPARPGAPVPPPAPPRELGTFDGMSRDLRESPFAIEVDLAGIEDGAYVIEAEVFDGATSLGVASLGVFLSKGLDARLKALETAAASVPDGVRADVVYPGDFIKNVNRGRIELGAFNVRRDRQSRGDSRERERRQGSVQRATGDFERHYLLQGANEIMPYRVYVPKGYAAARPTALVIALHGLGANEDRSSIRTHSCRRSSPRSTAS